MNKVLNVHFWQRRKQFGFNELLAVYRFPMCKSENNLVMNGGKGSQRIIVMCDNVENNHSRSTTTTTYQTITLISVLLVKRGILKTKVTFPEPLIRNHETSVYIRRSPLLSVNDSFQLLSEYMTSSQTYDLSTMILKKWDITRKVVGFVSVCHDLQIWSVLDDNLSLE